MQKLLLKLNKDIKNFTPKNLEFLKSFLSLYDRELNILSILLLWAIETKVLKSKLEDKFILYFNNQFKPLQSIFTADFQILKYFNRTQFNLQISPSLLKKATIHLKLVFLAHLLVQMLN